MCAFVWHVVLVIVAVLSLIIKLKDIVARTVLTVIRDDEMQWSEKDKWVAVTNKNTESEFH